MKISALQKARAAYEPKLPQALKEVVKVCEGAATESVADQEAIKSMFPNTYGLPIITFEKGGEAKVIESPYFTMVMHDVAENKELDRSMLDSFIIYIAIKGDMTITADGVSEQLKEGEVVLIPAEVEDVLIEVKILAYCFSKHRPMAKGVWEKSKRNRRYKKVEMVA